MRTRDRIQGRQSSGLLLLSAATSALLSMTACQREVKSCIEGTLLPCVCSGGQHGQALCLPGGTAATSCQCEPPPDLAGPDLATPADLGEPHDQSSEHLRWVFVTSAVLQGNFQSYISANTYCGLIGSSRLASEREWVAWTSTDVRRQLGLASDGKRIWRQVQRNSTDRTPTIKEARIYEFDPMSNNSFTAEIPIQFDEDGNAVSFPQRIWWPDPRLDSSCENWATTQADGGAFAGAYASLSYASLAGGRSQPCDQQAHILCLEK